MALYTSYATIATRRVETILEVCRPNRSRYLVLCCLGGEKVVGSDNNVMLLWQVLEVHYKIAVSVLSLEVLTQQFWQNLSKQNYINFLPLFCRNSTIFLHSYEIKSWQRKPGYETTTNRIEKKFCKFSLKVI